MKKIFTLISVVVCFIANAQVNEQWTYIENVSLPLSRDIVIDDSDYVYWVTNINMGNHTLYKFNSTGDTIWKKATPLAGNINYNKLVLDTLSNIYALGSSDVSFNANHIVVKFDKNGDTVWTYIGDPYGLTGDQFVDGIVDNNSNLYVAGNVSTLTNSMDIVVVKFDINGDTVWTYEYDGPGNDYDAATNITFDNFGNIYVCGAATSTGPGPPADWVLLKLDVSGNLLWSKIMPRFGGGNSTTAGVLVGPDNNPVVAGAMPFNGLFLRSYYTVKFNSINGDTVWTKKYKGSGITSNIIRDIAMDDTGNIYVTGSSSDASTSDTYTTIKYSSSGIERWITKYGFSATNPNKSYEIALDDSNNVYVSGFSANGSFQDLATIKYNNAGVEQWTRRYEKTGASPDGLAIDNNGGVYVSDIGFATPGFILIKYCQNLPVVSGAKDTAICIGDTIQMSLAGGISYLWSPSTGISNDTIFNPLVFPNTTTKYTVRVSDPDGCWDTVSFTVTVNLLPNPVFTGSNLNNFAPLNSAFNDITGGITKWLWDFGDTLSGSMNTSINPNPTHIFNSIDTFDVTMTVWDINNCKASLTKTAFVKVIPASVSGYIFKETVNDTIKLGEVLLLDKNKPLNNPDTAIIQADGTYNFSAAKLIEYYILAKPDGSNYPNSIPTYYGNSVEWFNSTVLTMIGNSANNNIITNSVDATSGPGNIVGTVKQGPASNFDKVQGPGDPFNGIDVSLIDKSTGSAIAHDISDTTATNELDLSNLPAGNYTVYVDVTGVPLDVTMDIAISSTNNALSLDILVDSNLIYLGATSVTSINDAIVNYREELNIYPNPATGTMYFNFGLQESSKIQLSIVDNLGRTVATIIEGKYDKGSYSFNKDISTLDLADGIYFAKLLIDDKTITSKFIYTNNK